MKILSGSGGTRVRGCGREGRKEGLIGGPLMRMEERRETGSGQVKRQRAKEEKGKEKKRGQKSQSVVVDCLLLHPQPCSDQGQVKMHSPPKRACEEYPFDC